MGDKKKNVRRTKRKSSDPVALGSGMGRIDLKKQNAIQRKNAKGKRNRSEGNRSESPTKRELFRTIGMKSDAGAKELPRGGNRSRKSARIV